MGYESEELVPIVDWGWGGRGGGEGGEESGRGREERENSCQGTHTKKKNSCQPTRIRKVQTHANKKKKLTIHESHPANPLYMRYNLRKVGDREGSSGGMGRPHRDRVGVGRGDNIQRPASAIERPGLAQRLTPR
jgi:hypothetical protein